MFHLTSRPLLLVATLVTGVSQVACMGDWDREPETPRSAWEDSYYPGQSTVAPTPVATAPAPAVSYDDVDDTDPSAIATFQPVLSPYGVWVEDPTYGYVWVPDSAVVGPEFSPYLTHGHWAYTTEGQYWVSDFEWGWATFHYGRWVWVEGRGWAWIPGARYSPAWVEWRYGGGYVGWGPAYPRHCWRGGVAVWIDPYPVPYVFVSSHHFYHPHPHTVVAAPSAGPGLVASTKPYAPPPGGGPYVGAKPFVGPDPKTMGVSPSEVAKSTIPVPPKARPESVAWVPAPSSKISPVDKATIAKPGGGAYGKPVPGAVPPPSAGGKSVTLPGSGYAPPAAAAPKYTPTPGYSGKPFTPPPSYGTGPKPYTPPPSYGTGPKPYTPPPSYGGGGGYAPAPKPYSPPPTAYSPPPTYAPAPKPYSPPPSYGGGGGYAPAPKPYSPPPSFGGGGGYAPAPKPYSPPPSFGGGGGGGGFSPAPKTFSPPPSGGSKPSMPSVKPGKLK